MDTIVNVVATSATGKSTLFDERANVTFKQPYVSTRGVDVIAFGILADGILFIESDWSTKPVKLSDLADPELKIQVVELMSEVLSNQWRAPLLFDGREYAHWLDLPFKILCFIGHTMHTEDDTLLVGYEDIRAHLEFVKDHWIVDPDKHNSDILSYHDTITSKIVNGEFAGILLEPNEFLLDIYDSRLLIEEVLKIASRLEIAEEEVGDENNE